MNKILSIIVTYKRKELLKENIDSLLKQNKKNFDILIVDNNSLDGTEEVVKSFKSKRVIYKNTGDNLGCAGGFGYGMKYAIENNYEYCWIMDDDTMPHPDALEKLLEGVKKINNNFSYLCSYVEWIDGAPCKMNMPRVHKKWFYSADKLQHNMLRLLSGTFVSLFINMEEVIKYGLPIKKMFIYGDDHEFTERISKDKPGYMCTNSVVTHKMPTNDGFDVVNVPKEKVPRYFYDSRNRFYRARKSSFSELIIYFGWIVITSIKIIAKSKDCKLKRLFSIYKGFFSGLFFNPKIEYVKSKN